MQKNIVCFGEVLWDILPSGPVAGGAPMNVAIRLQSLGMPATIISRTGNDKCGNDLVNIIRSKRVNISCIQQDPDLPTGEVLVKLSADGTATYDIIYPSAWDKIEATGQNIQAAKNADAFVFGSLACRDTVSRDTLFQLLEQARFRIFDVNLRKPFYSPDLVLELMQRSDFIKLNDEELAEIVSALGATGSSQEEHIRFLSEKTSTNHLCVTRGKDGAVLFTGKKFYSHPGYTVLVADTIGAGDSFLAALIKGFLTSDDHEASLDYASAVGALVASRKGAIPELQEEEIQKLMQQK
ncbi:MAG: carbohydrate kinase [Ferruginibacter sp.]